jgi:serine/threonine protein kinase
MDALPSLIGRYQIRQQLGQGGMGVLYLAFDPTMDRLVALKLLRVNDAQWRERFLREARLVARLQHPNIVTVHDVGSWEGQPFMAMEYIAGNTLDTMVRRRVPLSTARTLEIMIALCDGLAYAHRSGVIHRDVKPSNLIVHRDSGVLKVLDFGIARTPDSSLTLVGAIMGTPNYMSPEQVQGQVVDHRSDIFAVGVVFYELLAHRQAFSGETPFLILQDIVHREPEPLVQIDPTLDPLLDRIVLRAIAKDPEARYPDLDVMRRDLIEALRHTAPDEAGGREKTMVLLARAASGGRDRAVAAVATPPPMPVPVPAIESPGDDDDATSVLDTPPPSGPAVAAGEESAVTNVLPEPASAWAMTWARQAWDSHLVRIGLAAAAAVLLVVVLPMAVLKSRGSEPRAVGRDAHVSLLTAAALPRTSMPLAPEVPATRVDVHVAPAKTAANARAAVVSPALPVSSEPAAGRSDLKAMQQTLDRWKQAYESRDVAAVSRVWPTISTAQARSLDTAFDKMSQLTLLFRQCSLAGSVVRGAATCRVERAITFKTGKTETFPSRVAFQLEKRAERWVIVGVRGA